MRSTLRTAQVVFWTTVKAAAALAVAAWCALYLRTFDGHFSFAPPAYLRTVGIVLMLVGGAVALSCAAILSTRGIGSHTDRLFPREFVALGPFRYVRNPMSFGAIALFFGLALQQQSPSLLLLAVLLFLGLHLLVVYVEEPGLEQRFGDSYRSYKQSVNRWLPWCHPTGAAQVATTRG
jgi:protein-S-isoprenylcysteine O-methyltransferase Ste14